MRKELRAKLWIALMDNLPSVILVDLKKWRYHVQNPVLNISTDEELPHADIDELAQEVAEAFIWLDRWKIAKMLCRKALHEAYLDGKAPELHTWCGADTENRVKISVAFEQGSNGEVFEIRFEKGHDME